MHTYFMIQATKYKYYTLKHPEQAVRKVNVEASVPLTMGYSEASDAEDTPPSVLQSMQQHNFEEARDDLLCTLSYGLSLIPYEEQFKAAEEEGVELYEPEDLSIIYAEESRRIIISFSINIDENEVERICHLAKENFVRSLNAVPTPSCVATEAEIEINIG